MVWGRIRVQSRRTNTPPTTHQQPTAHPPQRLLPPVHARGPNPLPHPGVQLAPIQRHPPRRVRQPRRRDVHPLCLCPLPRAALALAVAVVVAVIAPPLLLVVTLLGVVAAAGRGCGCVRLLRGAVPDVEVRPLERLRKYRGRRRGGALRCVGIIKVHHLSCTTHVIRTVQSRRVRHTIMTIRTRRLKAPGSRSTGLRSPAAASDS